MQLPSRLKYSFEKQTCFVSLLLPGKDRILNKRSELIALHKERHCFAINLTVCKVSGIGELHSECRTWRNHKWFDQWGWLWLSAKLDLLRGLSYIAGLAGVAGDTQPVRCAHFGSADSHGPLKKQDSRPIFSSRTLRLVNRPLMTSVLHTICLQSADKRQLPNNRKHVMTSRSLRYDAKILHPARHPAPSEPSTTFFHSQVQSLQSNLCLKMYLQGGLQTTETYCVRRL